MVANMQNNLKKYCEDSDEAVVRIRRHLLRCGLPGPPDWVASNLGLQPHIIIGAPIGRHPYIWRIKMKSKQTGGLRYAPTGPSTDIGDFARIGSGFKNFDVDKDKSIMITLYAYAISRQTFEFGRHQAYFGLRFPEGFGEGSGLCNVAYIFRCVHWRT